MNERELTAHELAELDAATGDAPRATDGAPTDAERAAAAAHAAIAPMHAMPDALRRALIERGEHAIHQRATANATPRAPGPSSPRADAHTPPPRAAREDQLPTRNPTSPSNRWRILPWLLAAASLALAAGVAWYAASEIDRRETELATVRTQLVAMRDRADANEQLLADARSSAERLQALLAERDGALTEQERAFAAAEARNLELAERLATASTELDSALRRLARHEAPIDPAVLAQQRQKLLEVPETVRLAWQPFDLPDSPALQRGEVQGDVVWNDELEEGYLRFVGLKPNDPAVEQYQVWVIDERGMEQKVSGGVFNATADGELIVPIDPGIAVGRVAVFAITVENPGGIWVPDLSRRVVVAPRSDG